MLRFYLAILVFFNFNTARAQGVLFEKSFNYNYTQKADGIELISNSLIIPATINQANSFNSTGLLNSMDKNGNINWTKGIATLGMETIAYSKVIETSDSNILLMTSGEACCDCGGGYRELTKIDLNGNTIWSKLFNSFSFSSYTTHINLAEFPSGNILFNNQTDYPFPIDYFYIADEFGNVEDSIVYTHNQPIKTEILDSNNFVSATIDKVYKYNTSTGLIDSLNVGFPIMDMAVWNDTLVISTANVIKLYDFYFQLINSNSLTNVIWKGGLNMDSSKIKSFAYLNQDLAIISLGHDLTPMDTTIYADTLINHLYGCYDDTSMFTLSNLNLNSNNHQAVKLIGYDNNLSDNSVLYDISLSTISITDFSVDYLQSMTYNLYSLNPEIAITVVNNTSEILNSLKISCRRGSGICNDLFYDAVKGNLNIAPGDSSTISVGFVGFGERINVDDGSLVAENLCVTISTPNGHFDNKIDDNSLCEYYSVGYGEVEEVNNLNLKLFPNPSMGESRLQFDEEFTGEVLIYNVLGELVKSFEIFNAITYDINFQEFAKGMYMLKIVNEYGGASIINLMVE